jgi:hypothetical protein
MQQIATGWFFFRMGADFHDASHPSTLFLHCIPQDGLGLLTIGQTNSMLHCSTKTRALAFAVC